MLSKRVAITDAKPQTIVHMQFIRKLTRSRLRLAAPPFCDAIRLTYDWRVALIRAPLSSRAPGRTDTIYISRNRNNTGSSTEFCSVDQKISTARRVAVCLGTHCNIGLKRSCCPLASDLEPSHVISTVHLWRRAVPPRVDIVVINCCRL